MRARNIKPSFWENEELGHLSHSDRLLFIGLWCLADRDGKLEDRIERIRHQLFGYDRRPVEVEKGLCNLMSINVITRYEVAGKRYIRVNSFQKHQNPHPHEKRSKIPDPVECRDMSLHLTKCTADILNPDILNPERESELGSSPPPPDSASPNGNGQPTAEQLIALWNSRAHPVLPRVRLLVEPRKTHVRARLAEHPEKQFWEELIERVNKSPVLTGQNDRGWKASFDFILKPVNQAKILEGNYDRR